ncbi:hypothetical protein [Pseudonocardia acaciae]|uniref:hypothetical protein n=1 Tax=Pseudonocardia acaciae TaxID=551276 RepID=UPI00055DC990|nr:hypothetical protein [Pseudonocardia acaciae]
MLMATLLARMPDLRDRVQAKHVPDHAGRCIDCGGGTAWPCELYQIATEAEYLEMQQPPYVPRPSEPVSGYLGAQSSGPLSPYFQPLQPTHTPGR